MNSYVSAGLGRGLPGDTRWVGRQPGRRMQARPGRRSRRVPLQDLAPPRPPRPRCGGSASRPRHPSVGGHSSPSKDAAPRSATPRLARPRAPPCTSTRVRGPPQGRRPPGLGTRSRCPSASDWPTEALDYRRQPITMEAASFKALQLAAVAAVAVVTLLPTVAAAEKYQAPYFIHQCERSDPEINKCLQYAANTLVRHFRSGIPELEVNEVEPIQIEEIHLALGSGPDGYRAIFRDVEAFGVSNMTVTGVRSNLDSLEFQFSFYIPHITARAQYRSSGVLIMVQATGGGDYWGEYEGVRAKVYFKARQEEANDLTYLQVDDIKMDFSVKDIKMGIKSAQDNAIIEAALNLFINTNSQELLKEMKPSIKKHLLVTMRTFINNLFGRVPYEYWIIDE